MSKLDETYNFLYLYLHAAGKWKTPTEFHQWACIALVAACVEDRVYSTVFEHAPLHPNLWTFLVGGSGVGKDHAIGFALSFLEPDDPIMMVDGKITVPAMYDMMAKYQKETGRDAAPMFLVSSDLPEQLPPGPESVEFTSRVLQLYGGRKRVLADHTRTSGDKYIRNPLLNWVAGVVPRWFPKAVHPDVFHSGLAGRSLFIHGEKNHAFGHLRSPILPPDYDLIRTHLRERVKMLLQVEGPMPLTRKAGMVLDEWLYQHSKEQPRNDIEEAIHERKLALLLKLATISALCEWQGGDLRAQRRDIAWAVQMLPAIARGAKKVGEFVYKTPDTQLKDHVADIVRGSSGGISRSMLTIKATGRGVKDAKHLDSILDTLVQSGQVVMRREKQGSSSKWTRFYSWNDAQKRGLRELLGRRKDGRAEPEDDKEESEEADESDSGDSGGGGGEEGSG